MQRRAHRRHFTHLMRCVEEKLVMLLLVSICISIAKAERFDTVHWHVENLNKWEEITDMLDGRNDAFGEATQE